MSEANKPMSYNEVMDSWVQAYKFCLSFEAQYAMGKVKEEEFNEYLDDKAKLIVSVVDIFMTKCMDDKNEYNEDYVNELYTDFKDRIDKAGIKLLSFDDNYIDDMMKELYEEMKKAPESEVEKNEADTSEDE